MAKSERCPFCGASVKPENLIRHLDANHPRNAEAKAMREQLRKEPGRTASGRSRPAFRLRRTHVAVILIVAALGLGAYYAAPLLSPSTDFVTACSGTIAVHYHTLLVVDVNGAQKEVPADIGLTPSETNPKYACPAGEDHVLHTHDGSGIIHNELPSGIPGTPTLGDFFTIWGQPLGASDVWIYTGSVSASVYSMATHQSRDYSSNPGGIPLAEPPNGQDAYSIPQNLLYPGGGSGESNGVFSGEIIFLNVTAG